MTHFGMHRQNRTYFKSLLKFLKKKSQKDKSLNFKSFSKLFAGTAYEQEDRLDYDIHRSFPQQMLTN